MKSILMALLWVWGVTQATEVHARNRERQREREGERERWRGHSAHIAVTHTIYSWSGHKSHNPGDSSAPHSGYCVANILRQERWASKWQKTERPIFYKFWQPGWLFHLCETRIDAGHLCFEREGGEGGGGLLYVSELLELVPAPESEWVRERERRLHSWKERRKAESFYFFSLSLRLILCYPGPALSVC